MNGRHVHTLQFASPYDGQDVFVWSDCLLILARTSSLLTCSFYEMRSILRSHEEAKWAGMADRRRSKLCYCHLLKAILTYPRVFWPTPGYSDLLLAKAKQAERFWPNPGSSDLLSAILTYSWQKVKQAKWLWPTPGTFWPTQGYSYLLLAEGRAS